MDWHTWNDHYDNADSELSKRLNKVKEYLKNTLLNIEIPTVLNICSGQGKDILESMVELDKDAEVYLIDTNTNSLNAAINFAKTNNIGTITFINEDASHTSTYKKYDIPKSNIVLACGLFGHLNQEDSYGLVDFLKTQIKANGTVIWTKNIENDSISNLRKYFIDNNFEEISYFGPEGSPWAVVCNKYIGEEFDLSKEYKIFNFIDRD